MAHATNTLLATGYELVHSYQVHTHPKVQYSIQLHLLVQAVQPVGDSQATEMSVQPGQPGAQARTRVKEAIWQATHCTRTTQSPQQFTKFTSA
jgi:hypothetical protein